ncbi:hypothetical protein AA958_15610 [Streptomyces sp. CNQ-509]|nr:hypothetical protein AA958_15610 [Streptomyces sp. CNQ-509]
MMPVGANGCDCESRFAVESRSVVRRNIHSDSPHAAAWTPTFTEAPSSRSALWVEFGCSPNTRLQRSVFEVGSSQEHDPVLSAGTCLGQRLLQKIRPEQDFVPDRLEFLVALVSRLRRLPVRNFLQGPADSLRLDTLEALGNLDCILRTDAVGEEICEDPGARIGWSGGAENATRGALVRILLQPGRVLGSPKSMDKMFVRNIERSGAHGIDHVADLILPTVWSAQHDEERSG